MSWIAKSRTRKTGESIAHAKAAPRAMASSWLRVVESTFPGKIDWILARTAGIRVHPPTSSTASICSRLRPASWRACARGAGIRSSTLAIRVSYCSLFMFEEASISFMIDSTFNGASVLAESIFLTLSHPAVSRKVALGLDRTSILYFVLNCSAKWLTRARSM